MADVVRKIEITAALSPDYQRSFKAASDIAKDTSAQIVGLSKREGDLQRLLALDAKRAAAAQSGNAKEAEKAGAAYDKLAQRLGVTGKSAGQLNEELRGIGARRSDLEKLNRAASRRAELGRAAADVQRLSAAYKKFKDPALLKALDAAKQRFARLGGAFPKERQISQLNGIGAALQSVPGPVGAVASSLAGLKSMLTGPAGVVAGIAGLTVAAVAAGKALWDLGVEAIKSGDKTIKTADALGISTDAYQELSYAMQRGGASAEDFNSALKHIEQQMGAVASGNGRATKAFEQFGISARELKGMNAEEAFYAIAEGISKIDDPSKRMRASIQLLGGSGDKLAHAMSGGAAGLDELRKAARKAGFSRSRAELEQAAEAADKMLDAQLSLKGAFSDVAYAVMPAITQAFKDFAVWVQDNREAIQRFAGIAGSVMRGAATVVGTVFKGIDVGISAFVKGIEFWQEKTASAIEAVVGFFTDVKNGVVSAFEAAIKWLNDLIDGIVERYERVKRWVKGESSVVLDTSDEETEARREQRYARMQGVYQQYERAQAPAVTVNIDARGGDSETAAQVQRALERAGVSSSSAPPPGVIRAFESYGALASGG